MGRLVALAGPRSGETFPLADGDISIGRDGANQLSIPDHLMSRRHCTVAIVDGRFILRDLGSSNGTFINGIPVHERVLEHGDRIRAGQSVMLFLAPVGTEAGMPDAAGNGRTTRIRVDEAAQLQPDRLVDTLLAAHEDEGAMILRAKLETSRQLVGNSAAMHAVYGFIAKVAPADSTVLIEGETGTGKELVAQEIHKNSPRARRPFVAVNCAALTESLLESELFGHEKGAFTGAIAQKRGKLELADGGTIFLDEIGDLAMGLQAKLLRALQQHEFERVGGTRTIKVDMRVIAATNQDLGDAVSAGRFRRDLWYRLNVVGITMPPLRERRTDIPLLAAHFATRHGRGGPVEISNEAIEVLCAYDWPGNVRELENAIERAIVLGGSHRVMPDDHPETILESTTSHPGGSSAGYHRGVFEAKRRLILDAVERSGGNYTAAARLLGVNPTYLHRLLRNLQLREASIRR